MPGVAGKMQAVNVQLLEKVRFILDPETQKIVRLYDFKKQQWARDLAERGKNKGANFKGPSASADEQLAQLAAAAARGSGGGEIGMGGVEEAERLRNEWDTQWEAEGIELDSAALSDEVQGSQQLEHTEPVAAPVVSSKASKSPRFRRLVVDRYYPGFVTYGQQDPSTRTKRKPATH